MLAGRQWQAGCRRAPWERGRGAQAGRPPPTKLRRIEATLAVASILGSRKPRRPAKVS
jgi:hypothetical protein